MALKFDISCLNFDSYFSTQSVGISEGQKENLPKELAFKLFKHGGKEGSTSNNKLSFLAKIFILVKALRKRVIILIEDENGMDEEQYFKYKKLLSKNKFNVENSQELVTDGIFVLANKEIVNTYSAINLLAVSKPYRYLVKAKNAKGNNTEEYVTQMNYISKFLSFYESNRKKLTINTGLTMAEWLTLIHIYHGNDVESSTIYKEWYRYSCNSSSAKIKMAFSSLQSKGYAEKIGVSKGAKLRITALGKIKTNEVLNKFALNC